MPKPSRPAARQSTPWISTSASISCSPMRRRSAGVSSAGGHARDDHLALDSLHHVERRADRRLGRRTPPAPPARAPACRAARAAGAPRAARRARSAAAAGAAGGAARPRCSSRSIRYVTFEWPSPIGVARSSPAPRPCASRNARSGSSTSSGGRLLASASAGVWTMSSGAIGVLTRPERYKDRNLLCAEVSQATMPRIRTLLLSLLACALLAGSVGAAQALASHSQITYFEASNDLLEPSTRPHVIAQLQHLGVTRCASSSTGAKSRRGPTARPSRASKRPTRRATTGAGTRRCSPKPSGSAGRCC